MTPKLTWLAASMIALGNLSAFSPAFAQSAEQIAACTPDAFNLCRKEALAGDRDGVARCFDKRRRELSAACKAAIGKR
jgi:hypothetical protein